VAEIEDLVVRWQRGWGIARSLPAGEDAGGAIRVHCRQRGREVEYVVTDPDRLDRVARLVLAEEAVTWLTVAAADPGRAAAALRAAGLVLIRPAEQLMTIDLREHPRREPPDPYRARTRVAGEVVTVEVLDAAGAVAASGAAGLSGSDAIADRIGTFPAHRRRGLAAAVMGALAGAAVERGARTGILVASADGQRLYPTLGWRPVAGVLVAAAPGTVHPDDAAADKADAAADKADAAADKAAADKADADKAAADKADTDRPG
jgi:GNAT superfamily N-acetyltransferase